MYIGRDEKEEKEVKDKVSSFFASEKDAKNESEESEYEEKRDFINSWEAPEYEIYQRGKNWYLVILLFLVAIIAYAVFTDSPLMAITFILIGVVGYIFVNKEPRVLTFGIDTEGVWAGKQLYSFKNDIESFWIFYEPDDIKVISLKLRSKFSPPVHIPLKYEDPVEIREILLKYIPEKEQELSVADKLEKIIGISN